MYIKHEIYAADIAGVANENLPWEKLAGKSLLLTGATGLIGTLMIDVLMKKNRDDNLNVKIFAVDATRKLPTRDSPITSTTKIFPSSSWTSTSRLPTTSTPIL